MTDSKNRTFNFKKESIIGKTQPKSYYLNLNKNNSIQKKKLLLKIKIIQMQIKLK